MTLQEVLKAQGLSEEQIEKILGDMKSNKIFTSSEENLDVRYGKLKGEHDSLTTQHGEAQKLINELKEKTGKDVELQEKITTYEGTVADLQSQLEETKLESAIKLALLKEKASDVDYLAYKLKQKGELKLDKDGNIGGIDNLVKDLKAEFPTQFEKGATGGKYEEKPLNKDDKGSSGAGMTRSDFLKKPYAERAAFAAENPEEFATLMNE